MPDKCPGAADMRTPTLKIKNCPECNGEVELFSVVLVYEKKPQLLRCDVAFEHVFRIENIPLAL